PVGAVADIDVVIAVDGNGVRQIELAGVGAFGAPLLYPIAVLVEFGHARIDVAVADVDVALRIPGDIGGLTEQAVDGGERRLDVLPGLRLFLGGFLAAAEDPEHAPGRIELDDHVRAFVDGPDVVVLVDAHRVRERPGI